MQHKYLGSLKYFFLSLLIYLPKQSVCLCFALLCISFSFWPATSRSHPCWVARAICSPNARDESPPDPAKAHHRLQNGNKTKQKSFKLALWHLRASTFTQSLSPPPIKLTRKMFLTASPAPQEVSTGGNLVSRRSVFELWLHCFLSCVCQHAGVSTSCPAAAAESLSDNLFGLAVTNTSADNVHSQTTWIVHQSCIYGYFSAFKLGNGASWSSG